jgi:NADH dehydrogenase
VIHLAAAIRDQPGGSIEELNAMATLRLVRAAEKAGVRRFIFFSAIGASPHSPARFFRAKALAEEAVDDAELDATVFAPSIVYSPDDQWITLLDRLTRLPVAPVSGRGEAVYQPIWAEDVADCVVGALNGSNGAGRYELAGPESLSYDGIVKTALRAFGRRRRLLHVPLPLVKASLAAAGAFAGPSVFATWDEAELMELSMTTPKGTADAQSLGVKPLPMAAVLGAR